MIAPLDIIKIIFIFLICVLSQNAQSAEYKVGPLNLKIPSSYVIAYFGQENSVLFEAFLPELESRNPLNEKEFLPSSKHQHVLTGIIEFESSALAEKQLRDFWGKHIDKSSVELDNNQNQFVHLNPDQAIDAYENLIVAALGSATGDLGILGSLQDPVPRKEIAADLKLVLGIGTIIANNNPLSEDAGISTNASEGITVDVDQLSSFLGSTNPTSILSISENLDANGLIQSVYANKAIEGGIEADFYEAQGFLYKSEYSFNDNTSGITYYNNNGSSITKYFTGSEGTGQLTETDFERTNGTSAITTYDDAGNPTTTVYSGPNGTGNVIGGSGGSSGGSGGQGGGNNGSGGQGAAGTATFQYQGTPLIGGAFAGDTVDATIIIGNYESGFSGNISTTQNASNPYIESAILNAGPFEQKASIANLSINNGQIAAWGIESNAAPVNISTIATSTTSNLDNNDFLDYYGDSSLSTASITDVGQHPLVGTWSRTS